MFRKIAPILALIGVGIGMGTVLLLLLIQVFPNLAPGGQRFLFTDLDGDTFRHQPGLVRPPSENRVLEDGVRFDDADGFRRPLWTAADYPIIAIGDSFTDGGQVPWTDILAQQIDQPVRNLGWSGFGPLEYAEVMVRYGRSDHQWVLVMFFEGNDLSNIQTSSLRAEQNGGVLPFDLTRVIGAPITDMRQLDQYSDIVIDPNDAYLYPLTQIRPDGSTYEMAYISDYLWWLNGDPAVLSRVAKSGAIECGHYDDPRSSGRGVCGGGLCADQRAHLFPICRSVWESALCVGKWPRSDFGRGWMDHVYRYDHSR